jgi:Family of unknown function (DUF6069)
VTVFEESGAGARHLSFRQLTVPCIAAIRLRSPGSVPATRVSGRQQGRRDGVWAATSALPEIVAGPPTKVGRLLDRGLTGGSTSADVEEDTPQNPGGMTDFEKRGLTRTPTVPASPAEIKRHVRSRRAAVVAGAAAAAGAAWTLLDPVGGVDLAVKSGDSVNHIQPASVLVTALLAALAGWGLLAWFERSLKRPHRTWVVTATGVFLISLVGPLGGVTGGAKLGLALLHVTVAAVVIGCLPRAGRRASP